MNSYGLENAQKEIRKRLYKLNDIEEELLLATGSGFAMYDNYHRVAIRLSAMRESISQATSHTELSRKHNSADYDSWLLSA